MRVRQVCWCAWSHTPRRCSPVARELMLMTGGRALAEVPCPVRLLARRRGGSVGSGCGVRFFPRVLVQLIGLEGRPPPHLGRGGLMPVALKTLPEGLELFA
jgi:hypothetical protein